LQEIHTQDNSLILNNERQHTCGHIDLSEGKIWAVDKPLGWSSFHVVKKLRGALLSRVRHHGVKKLKVGHAGTLDPLASGVMILCLGKATKEIDRLQSGVKEYVAELQLGSTTPSFDLETPVDATYPTEHISRELVDSVIPGFVGTISQVPPAYSACKVDGKRAYKMARGGETVELKPKILVIDLIEVLNFDPEKMTLTLRIVCSKGTYIRALARDIGEALKSGAHLIGLRRTRVGDYSIDECLQIEDAVADIFKSEITVAMPDGKDPLIIPPGEYIAQERTDAVDKRDILTYQERIHHTI
jgi:tRNA pseudouridine55 synthase